MSAFYNNKKEGQILWLTIISLSMIVTWVYLKRVEYPLFDMRVDLQSRIIAGEAESPYRYRILIPYISHLAVLFLTSAGASFKVAFLAAHSLINFVCTSMLLFFSYKFFREFYTSKTSLIGIVFLGGVIHIALQDHAYQPWSLLEGGLFAITLYCLKKNSINYLPVIIVAGTLNRETAIFIPVVIFFVRFSSKGDFYSARKVILEMAAPFLIWLCIYTGLRYVLGSANHIHSLHEILTMNMEPMSIARAIFNWSLMLGGWWILLIFSIYKFDVDEFLLRAWKVLFAMMPLIAIYGVWYEVRMLIPLYPLAIATCLQAIEKSLPD